MQMLVYSIRSVLFRVSFRMALYADVKRCDEYFEGGQKNVACIFGRGGGKSFK